MSSHVRASDAIAAKDDRRRTLGRHGERIAAEHLRRRGFSALARNHRTRHGEIDLIAFDGHTLVFVEVKTRRLSPRAPSCPERSPVTWLRRRQLARMRRLAVAWLADPAHARPAAARIRFDAIGVLLDRGGRVIRLDHIEGAC